MFINDDVIIKDNDSRIREKSKDVTLPLSDEDKELLLDMLQYVDDSTNEEIAEKNNLKPAVGISAIQIGIPKKLTAIIIKDENGEYLHRFAFANPKIVSYSVEKTYLKSGEGCLSVPENHEGYVYRSNKIRVVGYDLLQDKQIELKVSGYLAVVMQHELDHFKGVLYYDHIDQNNPFKIDDSAIVIE